MKFYPDYFSFPNTEGFQQADNGDSLNGGQGLDTGMGMSSNPSENVGQMEGIVTDQNQEMYSGMNGMNGMNMVAPQETRMETHNQNGYGLESGSQFGSPMKGGGRGMEEETY